MLEIKKISKVYKTESLKQLALDNVSVNFRENEFASILGPSGSGKTTLLNIIGGLDKYTSGDLVINEISTKKYKDRDWDSYRNHRVGFVFQSYNLIPHQTILRNVELALTLSGVTKSGRTKRAKEALKMVGLERHINKKPNQLSGGQMQRVAIARALVNNPDIVLADEPTGALDSETSKQIMELLASVAKDKLVIMVTHNPELAREYSTRIIELKDGKIINDTKPYDGKIDTRKDLQNIKKKTKKTSMSFITALSLSLNNLMIKKGRTILTAVAGSIGIIGIALILSLSTGVNEYIEATEESTLAEYPLQITKSGVNFASMLTNTSSDDKKEDTGDINTVNILTNLFSSVKLNDLKAFKEYLDSDNANILEYAKAIEYKYDVTPLIYNDDLRQLNPNATFDKLNMGSSFGAGNFMQAMMNTDVFYALPKDKKLYENGYDVKAGRLPEKYNECVLVLSSDGSITDLVTYILGLRDFRELDKMIEQFSNGEQVDIPKNDVSYSYDDILNMTFKLVRSSDLYEYDAEYKLWAKKDENEAYMKKIIDNSEELIIVGIIEPKEDATVSMMSSGIYYSYDLIEHIIAEAENSKIVKDQIQRSEINVFTGKDFNDVDENAGLNFGSLIEIDKNLMEKAITFDTSKINLDFSGFDGLFSSNDFPEINFEEFLSQIDFDLSKIDIQKLAKKIMREYEKYIIKHPEADFNLIIDQLKEFIEADSTKEFLKKEVAEITNGMMENVDFTLTEEQIQKIITDIAEEYERYAAKHGFKSIEEIKNYFLQFINASDTEEMIKEYIIDMINNGVIDEQLVTIINQFKEFIVADSTKTFLSKELAELIREMSENIDFTISDDMLNKIVDDIIKEYEDYAVKHNFTTFAKLEKYLIKFIKTDNIKNIISDFVTDIIKSQELDTQIGDIMSEYIEKMGSKIGEKLEDAITSKFDDLSDSMADAFNFNEEIFAKAINFKMDENKLMELLTSLMSKDSSSYENNLKSLGFISLDEPSEIDIYPKNFEANDAIIKIINEYNDKMKQEYQEDKVISYTDLVGSLLSSITTIVDVISYVLIAFVGISLVVSSLMIGIITYISVLERKKEIGILRAIGASKQNVSQVFNAETFIIGMLAGIIGIGVTLILLIPTNHIIQRMINSNDVRAVLPIKSAIILIILSTILTLIGGFIPSKKAAKEDPVTALRAD